MAEDGNGDQDWMDELMRDARERFPAGDRESVRRMWDAMFEKSAKELASGANQSAEILVFLSFVSTQLEWVHDAIDRLQETVDELKSGG